MIKRISRTEDRVAIVLADDGVVVAIDKETIAIYESEEHYLTDPAHPREITPRLGIYGHYHYGRYNGNGTR